MLSRRHLPLAWLLILVTLVYANSLGNGFHFDDFHTIVDNPAVRSLGNLHRIFTDTTAFSVLPANQTYRPVVTASLALDYALAHGYTPFWFHLSTLLWFLVLVSLLFFLAQQVFDRTQPEGSHRWLALGVAAWFGLHPAMAETVNYIIQRGDLYCTLGCVAALSAFIRWPAQRRYGWYLLPFVLAMLSKPTSAVFPLLLLLYLLLFETADLAAGRRWRTAVLSSLPAAAVTAILLWLQAAMTPKTFLPSTVSPVSYRLTQPFVWLRYAGALFLPLHLNVDTDLGPFSSLNPRAVAGLLFFVFLLAVIAYTARSRSLYPITYGLSWFLVTQLPTSLYPLSEVENDHRMFFSFPGLMIAVVWALSLAYLRLTRPVSATATQLRWLRTATAVGVAFCLAGYAYGAHRRNQVWRTEETLWADDAAKSPGNGRGLMIYGLTRMNVGDLRGALDLFTRAAMFTPNYPTLEINLGVVNGLLAAAGQPARGPEAESHFRRAIELAPGDDTTHAFFGRWLLQQGRLAEARTQLEAAVSLNGQREMQRDLLLGVYQQTGQTEAAHQLALQTLTLMPGNGPATAFLHAGVSPAGTRPSASHLIEASLAAYRAGDFEKTITDAKQALLLDSHSAEAWNNLGAGYGGLHQWAQGVDAEQHALALNPQLSIAANNLHWFSTEQAKSTAATSPQSDSGSDSGDRAAAVAEAINLSLQLNRQTRYNESIAAARRALVLDPSSAEAWNNIAAGEEALHHWAEAIAAAQHAIALKPDFQLARNNLAWSLQQQRAASTSR